MQNKVLLFLFIPFLFIDIQCIADTTKEKKITFIHYPGVYYTFESGVSSRLSLQDIAKFNLSNRVFIGAAWRFHINQHTGMGSVNFAVEEWKTGLKWLSFGGELVHLEFSDYKIGENQAIFISYLKPFRHVYFGIGIAYKSPNLKNTTTHSLFDWNNEMNELYPVFQVNFDLITLEQWRVRCNFGTYEFMQLQTKDHLFIRLKQEFIILPNIRLHLDVSSGIKNISGMSLTVNELHILTGVAFYY